MSGTLPQSFLENPTFIAGWILGLALVKFGNPIIFSANIPWPRGSWEWAIQSWPFTIGYLVMAGFALICARFFQRPSTSLPWAAWLPLAWIAWVLFAAAQSSDPAFSRSPAIHLLTVSLWFYMGFLVLARMPFPHLIWIGLGLGLLAVLAVGWQQHFWGLKATRDYFYSRPDWKEFPPEFIQRIQSNRIYGTLFYPNSLAAALLLLTPGAAYFLYQWKGRSFSTLKLLAWGSLILSAAGCLYWSGSKAGWLVAVAQLGMVILFFAPGKTKHKILGAGVVLVIGLGLLSWRYQDYFSKGATSASARSDYWKAALTIAHKHPIVGTGPGTFGAHYKQIKPENAEMTKMVHNDYLQQAAESGWPSFLLFSGSVIAYIVLLYRKRSIRPVDVGVFGYLIHSFFEFSLYIPALSWSAAAIIGLRCGQLVFVIAPKEGKLPG